MAKTGRSRRERRAQMFFFSSLALFVLLVLLCLALLIRGKQSYVFVEDGYETRLETYEKDPEKAMAEAGITLGYGDSWRIATSGRTHFVKIDKGICVSLSIDGETSIVSTSGPCVRDVLRQVGADLSPDDILNCSPGDLLYDGMEISLTTVRYEYVSYLVPTAGGVEFVSNPAVPDGETNIMVDGCSGTDSILFCDTYVGGVRVSREECGRCTVAAGEARVIEMGTGQLAGQAVMTADGRLRAIPEKTSEELSDVIVSEQATNWSSEGDEGDANAS